jgi:pimeloyl-ACP methyl ester carboxylesterase
MLGDPLPMSMAGASGGKAGAGGASGAAGAAGSKAGSGGSSMEPMKRPQDDRTFTIDESTLPFDALPDPTVETDRYTGVLDGAGYRIEVPKNWNGILVMYAHGYTGTMPALRVTTPSIRRYLVEKGYAWAASSYTKNYYDVRVGVEDTNKLALKFKELVTKAGRAIDEPKKRYLIGHSMGGHITGAAIEKEAAMTAVNKVQYAAAMPMCGVMGDTELFNFFAAYQFAAQQLAGTEVKMNPADFMNVRMQTQDALFSTYPTATTPEGDKLKAIVRNLTGGARPNFDLGFGSKQWQDAVWGTFGGDGTINGILTQNVIDTREIVYQLDDDPAQSEEEKTFNMKAYRSKPVEGANALRSDGLRWIPKVNGEFSIPVLSLHTLGDLYVPFMMEQIYRKRAMDKGNADRLVQRAIRGTGHCEFTYAEQATAFEALAKWEQEGVKPEGDDVLDAKKLADPNYGCKFTQNTYNADEMTAGTLPMARAMAAPCP